MSNFAFVPNQFQELKQAAQKAESHIHGDPRAACFHARFALEAAVHWLYRYDNTLRMPYDHSLNSLLHEPDFQNLIPQQLFHKAKAIQRIGNQAVHNPAPVRQLDALQMVKELHHIAYWLTRNYTRPLPSAIDWDDALVPRPLSLDAVVPRKQLEALEKQLAAENEKALKQQQAADALNQELQTLRQQLADLHQQAAQQTDTHDYSEADTRAYLIDVEIHRAGWSLNQKRDREYKVVGMPNNKGFGEADYVLWGDDGKPLAVIEAKRTTADPAKGQQQAKLYADCLEQMHAQRPIIYYTNGYDTWLWDDTQYPPRQVSSFYNKAALSSLILRRSNRQPLDTKLVNAEIAGRYYQKRAIGSICKQFSQSRRKALLVMATGTGKTRTAIALVDALQRANWIKRVLFLADRVSLVKQTANAFKKHLPDSSPVNLVTEKDTEGRVYVCTYPTMMGLINETQGKSSEARFGVGYFDLIIIDEAHRSVYQKYRSIFSYFDSLLVGLTATPREQVDKNTYELFELEPGVPTDAYELEKAIRDEFLVRPKVEQVNLRFPRDGIDYDSLSDEEKEEWESTDWGDNADGSERMPKKVNATAINQWLFNIDTADKVLKHLMEHGHKVAGNDRLGKTIIFARSHKHAQFIESRFNHHYPEHAGHFARIIDNEVKYAQSLIDDFSVADKAPHIAISVDMLDTGIDVPEVLNLVFFKPVYSRIKFWQMIGRGTRLCPDVFAPGEDKQDFRIFDFCFNFDFFREKPQGIEAGTSASLGSRLFQTRVQLLAALQAAAGSEVGFDSAQPTNTPRRSLSGVEGNIAEGNTSLLNTLKNGLFNAVAAMNRDNFIVRQHTRAVERFQERANWDKLSEEDCQTLHQQLAQLPFQPEADDVESRMFDLNVLRVQVALLQGDARTFETHRRKVLDIAIRLEEKTNIPAVKTQISYLQTLQEPTFWEGTNADILEDLRIRLRALVPFIDKRERKIVYTNFKDEILDIKKDAPFDMPKMTSTQYDKKVKDYLRSHLDSLVIHRLRTNKALTETDLQGLETTLIQIGEDEGNALFSDLLARHEAPSLPHFVRSMVGMDHSAAHEAFSQFLHDKSLTPAQIRFIEMIIEQLTARGIMESSALYEAPFTSLHSGGPDALFAGKDNVIDGLFDALENTSPKIQKAA